MTPPAACASWRNPTIDLRCAHVWVPKEYQAAATSHGNDPGVPHCGGDELVGRLAVHPVVDGQAAEAAPLERVKAFEAGHHSPSPEEHGTGARCKGGGGSSTADADDRGWGELESPAHVAQAAVDVGAVAATEVTAAAACDGADTNTLRCRGGCHAFAMEGQRGVPRPHQPGASQGRALSGYCVVGMATVMRRACVLDLAVLATYPRCLVRRWGIHHRRVGLSSGR